MYPEDRVLVAYLPDPADFKIVQQEGWYRIPQKHAPKGIHAEYFAFYFGRKFAEMKWAIHYYARQKGHELVRRQDLFPDQLNHPRLNDYYYRVALDSLQKLDEPIISLRLRRITFMHTTWDRFQEAREINDLFIDGGQYVDRLYATLKERGMRPFRNYRVEENGIIYEIPISILCLNGRVDVMEDRLPDSDVGVLNLADQLEYEVSQKGGSLG